MRRIGGRDEQGVFLVLWALLLLGLLTMVAIVIDLGQVRAVRRTNKGMADFAVLAAGPKLAVSNPRGACQDALKNVRANALDDALATITQAQIESTCGNPSTPANPGLPQACPGTLPPTSPSRTLVRGDYTIRIFHPVLDADIADARLAGGAGVADGTPCQRLRIAITQRTEATFAQVVGVSEQTPTVASVIRGAADPRDEKVAALLLLERTRCQTLWTSGQGNVLVKEAGPDDPGILHADSFGTTGCSGSTSSAYVIYGTSVPSGNPRAGQPSIQVEGAATSPPTPCPGGGVNRGFLHLVFPFSGTAASVVDTGVCPAPTGGGITGRSYHDKRYNPVGIPGRTRTLDTLRAASVNLLTAQVSPPLSLAQTLRDKGYVVFPDDAGSTLTITPATPAPTCTTNDPYTISNAKVFINCAPLNAKNLTFTGTSFVANGALNVAAESSLRFPNATEIVVRGCTSGTCQGNPSANSGVDVNGVFTVNDGSAAVCVDSPSPPAVADRTGPTVAPAHVVVLKGRFSSNGANTVVRMCQTFLYMADRPSPQTTTTGDPTCLAVPCPLSNSFTGDVKTQGREIDWSAPNQSPTLIANDTFPGPYEDLALWTEAGGSPSASFNNESNMGGNSTTSTSGVFFMPNALFTFSGNTGLNQDFNAQFVARRLNLAGQGVLTMVPNPHDAVPTPFPSWRMIR